MRRWTGDRFLGEQDGERPLLDLPRVGVPARVHAEDYTAEVVEEAVALLPGHRRTGEKLPSKPLIP